MIGKLIIFGIIAVAAIVIFPNLLREAPNTGPLQTIKERIDYATAAHAPTNGTRSVGYGGILAVSGGNSTPAGSSGVQTSGTGKTSLPNLVKQTYTGQVFSNASGTCQVSVPGMAETINGQTEITHVIQVPNCNLPINRPVQVITEIPQQNSTQQNSTQQNFPQQTDQGSTIQVVPFYFPGGGGSQNDTGNQSPPPTAPPYFQTVQLNAVNQGTDAQLSYDDTTGKTTQVTVTMKNSERIIFSGTFYSSQFHTEVNDVPQTPHIIEMTIQNAIYGTLHASVYVPANIQNSTISGILSS